MENNNNSNIIEASPTKELFIYMLTRDIPLIKAILDLVDNSVDGIKRICTDDDYSKFWINIECKKDYFSISDNCGGIPILIAQQYAFRFGRSKKMEPTPGSIGKFGVGMKRSFFKLGNKFKIESNTSISSFLIEHDVREWIMKPDDWHFEFKSREEDIVIENEKIGTKIKITELFDNVSKDFSLENFITELRKEIASAHSLNQVKGLSIALNGQPIGINTISLLTSDKIRPAFFEKSYEHLSSPVNVKIYAGLAERDFEKGGWYVYCNGRLVLEANQSEITTWGGKNPTPKYHPDFAFFRGFVFFDSDNAELLPWTTTKNGVDVDSSLYKSVQLEMINLIGPILSFLRKLAEERAQLEKGEIESSPLELGLKETYSTNFEKVNQIGHFTYPQTKPITVGPKTGRIQYSKPLEDIKKVKKVLNVTTAKEVGVKTFDYFVEMEIEE